MYVEFKCFQCPVEKKIIKIHSYSWNKEKDPLVVEDKEDELILCEHFSTIELKWKTKYGFFTYGWQVEIYNVCIKCSKCNKRTLYFADQTFNKDNNGYEEAQDCCNNVVVYSAHEGEFKCDNNGKILQEKINQHIQALKTEKEENKKLKEQAEKLEKEEKLRKEKEEEERREKEEEERKEKEKEKKRRSQYKKENKEILEINKQQEKEEKELNQRINMGTSWIEEQMSQMITEENAIYSIGMNYNAQKTIKANNQIQAGK